MNPEWAVAIFNLAFIVTCGLASPMAEEKLKQAKKLVERLNAKNGGEWTAKVNHRFAQMSEEQRRMMAGGNGGEALLAEPEAELIAEADAINNEKRRQRRGASCSYNLAFDARTKWPDCAAVMNRIPDQSSCGGCWAVATAAAYTDRYCIERAKKGLKTSATDAQYEFSGIDVMSCAPGNGCNGGSTYNAWNWIKDTGIVSGSDYDAKSGCKPYPFVPQGMELFKAPACSKSCSNGGWYRNYQSDKKFAKWIGILGGPAHIDDIENEIRANGSVVASMDIYDGLYHYSDGIYKHVEDKVKGTHAVRIIGWGTRSCTDGSKQDYWLVPNTWGDGWGIDGYLQIVKGSNECGIEQKQITWGTPVV